MTTIIDERFARIREIVCDVLELDEDELTLYGSFVDEFGGDSLQAIEILSSLERAFGIVIDQSELARMVNLSAVADVVAESFGKQ
ncbi:acyl carrier protein [Streptomyces jumonjinensis]|uniref:Acyl carrier protein n=1 Tax=Streptomyces jumonjinensis TaxID=1945 RepID=A0A646KLX4_STRJU|nr:phosphopantetheine-binding protein [Streptomyces jumonjinensis]MQT03215.1 acyl carrier protein [Streptomyces jumonjinensis]